MRNNIFNYEGEEKEISLSSVKEMNSNTLSNNTQIKHNKTKVKFDDIPKLTIMHTQKTFGDKEKEKEKEIEKDNPVEIFERRKKKFQTLMTRQTKVFGGDKKKKRIKGKFKTSIIKKSNKKLGEAVDDDDKEKQKDKEKHKSKKTLNESKSSNQIDEDEEYREEFEDKEMQTKLEILLEKKFTPTQTMLSYCKCQLYISYDNMTGFEYTGLEGILCIMINRILSNLYLQIYDILDFKKQFEIELYTNILLNKGYEVMSEKFHTIEFPTFCLGINFYTIKKAEEIKNIILNYSKALNSSLFYQYEKKNHDTFKQKKLFDYISDPKAGLNYYDKKKKTSKDVNNQLEYNNLNNDDSNYLETMFGNINKKLNYKISSNEQMLSFSIDKEANEVTFDTSNGANRFLEQNNIEISDINEEYEKMKEKVKSKIKNNKFISNKTKKSIQEEIKDKENREKIMEILNQIEGLQINDKNNLNVEEEKEKLNNKIRKFNVTKRLPINQKMQITSPPENLVFYGDNSDSLGEDLENDEEGEEEEEDDDDEEEGINEEENNILKYLLKNNNINTDFNNPLQLNLNSGKNNSEGSNNNDNKSIKLQLSGIDKKLSNSSDISSNNSAKDGINNNNISKDNKQAIIYFSSKNSSIKGSNNNNSKKSNQ